MHALCYVSSVIAPATILPRWRNGRAYRSVTAFCARRSRACWRRSIIDWPWRSTKPSPFAKTRFYGSSRSFRETCRPPIFLTRTNPCAAKRLRIERSRRGLLASLPPLFSMEREEKHKRQQRCIASLSPAPLTSITSPHRLDECNHWSHSARSRLPPHARTGGPASYTFLLMSNMPSNRANWHFEEGLNALFPL